MTAATKANEALMAERYHDKYRDDVDLLESGDVAKAEGAVDTQNVIAMGQMLDNIEEQQNILENNLTSQGDLGVIIPAVLRDIVVADFAMSPMASISQQQTINEEIGTIYYQRVIAGMTKGNVTDGDSLTQNFALDADIQGYATSEAEDEALGDTTAATLGYTLNLLQAPVVAGTISIDFNAGALTATDDGNGRIIGDGFASTSAIDYATGVLTLDFEADPAGTFAILASYVADLETATALPSVSLNLTSAPIRANLFALRADLGQYASYSFQKRFGKNLSQMVSKTVLGALNNETMSVGIRRLAGGSVGSTNLNGTQPAEAVSLSRGEWISGELKRVLAQAELQLLVNAAVGGITAMVAGRDLCAWLSEHPRFKMVSSGKKNGPHIFGTIDGVTIIRVPLAAQLGVDDAYCVTKGENFLASLTRATYMPITVLPGAVNFANPLQGTNGLMTSQGFHAVRGMTTKIVMV